MAAGVAAQQQQQPPAAALDVGRFMPQALYSEGPTPGALQEMLDNIDKCAEQARADLFFTIMSSLSGTGSSDQPAVLAALAALADVSSSSGTEQWVAQCANKYMEMQQHVAALQAELKAAQAAADLEATLREFRAYIDNGQFNDAAFSLVQLRKILEDNSSSQAAAPSTPAAELAALQEGCAACERNLEEALGASLAAAFDVSREACAITITCRLPSGGDVGDMWGAMELAGSLDKHMASIAGVLLQEVLPLVLNGSAYLDTHIQPSGDAAMVRWYAAAPGPDGAYSTEHVEGQVMQLLALLGQSLFRQQPAPLAAFGSAFWEAFVAQYQAAFLRQIQGSSVAVLQARQAAARNMEQQAVSMGLAAPGSELASCLSRSIRESYHAVQEQYLAQARELLLAHDPHAEPVVVGQPLPLDVAFYKRYAEGKIKAWEALDPPSGWDTSGPVLATGYYHITNTALHLVMLMDDALAQACQQGDTSMAQAIVGAVSKMALMFSTMMPPPAASEAPLLALLRHNDLQYIAAHLLVVPFLFDPDLKPLLGAGLWFGNEALQLRNSARAAYNELLSVQVSAVLEELQPLLQQSAALAAGRAPASKEAQGDAAAAHRAVLHKLTRAGWLLWTHMAPGVALEASCALVDPVASEMAKDVLHKKDIGEAEGSELVALYQPLLQGLLPALMQNVDLSNQEIKLQGFDLKDLVQQALQHRCRALRRLDAVLAMLTQRLADIADAWESHALPAAGLTLREVVGLVKALFEDTDYRAVCLQRMEAAAEHA